MSELTREQARYQVARLIDGEPFMGGPRQHSLRVADQILDYLGWVDDGERCESGCSAPVAHHDIDGVPLCDDCWKEMLDEYASARREPA